MVNEFFRFFNEMIERGYYMHLEIGYNKVADYCVRVYRKGLGEDGKDLELCWAQDSDMELAFAKAYIEMKQWLRDNEGGY